MFGSLFAIFTLLLALVSSHNESGEWSCESSNSGTQLAAEFRPGVITLDGHPDDWKDIDGFEFSLLPALDPHEDDAYQGGKMTVKVCSYFEGLPFFWGFDLTLIWFFRFMDFGLGYYLGLFRVLFWDTFWVEFL